MSEIVQDRQVRAPAHLPAKPDAKDGRPRSKREVAAFELPRGSTEMKRSGAALPSRMSRWKR